MILRIDQLRLRCGLAVFIDAGSAIEAIDTTTSDSAGCRIAWSDQLVDQVVNFSRDGQYVNFELAAN